MGLFDKILGGKSSGAKEQTKVDWNELTSVDQLNSVVESSQNSKAIIFKHSTRCSISASVLNKFEKQVGEGHQLYFLDLIAHRDISAAISDKFKVVHQSPQAIVLEKGEVIQHDSHYGILDLTF